MRNPGGDPGAGWRLTDMMGGWGSCCGGWFGSLGGFGWIGLVINIVMVLTITLGMLALIIWVVRQLRNLRSQDPASPAYDHRTPREVLDIRYARGEISREDYHTIIADLG
jgi:uncharacterized membrane protein